MEGQKVKKVKNTTLISVLVLSSITIVCVLALVLSNIFFFVSEEERLKRAFVGFVSYENVENLYQLDKENSQQLKAFNEEYGKKNEYVDMVFRLKGGEDDGKVVIRSTGVGYGKGAITMYIVYDTEGKVYGIRKYKVAEANSFWNKIKMEEVSQSFSGGSSDKEFDNSLIKGGTGATFTLNGITQAVNLANKCYKLLVLGQKEEKEIVAEADLTEIKRLFTLDGTKYNNVTIQQVYKYPVRSQEISFTGNASGITGSAKVENVFVADETYYILDVSSSGGTYGEFSVYFLMDNDDATIAAAVSYKDTIYKHLPHDATALQSNLAITNLFKGVSLDEIKSMDKYLYGSTNATESNNGIKAAAFAALSSFAEMKQKTEEYDAQNSREEIHNG
jgi:Na+-translocating ferredoxin:NAD+ oxidoreductase RnfG subunit